MLLSDIKSLVLSESIRQGMDTKFVIAIINRENSQWNPSAVGKINDNGSTDYGLMQVNNKQWIGTSLAKSFGVLSVRDLLDPIKNIKLGIAILNDGFDRARKLSLKNKDADAIYFLTAAAYNGGFTFIYSLVNHGHNTWDKLYKGIASYNNRAYKYATDVLSRLNINVKSDNNVPEVPQIQSDKSSAYQSSVPPNSSYKYSKVGKPSAILDLSKYIPKKISFGFGIFSIIMAVGLLLIAFRMERMDD